jgi:hypothetical protein
MSTDNAHKPFSTLLDHAIALALSMAPEGKITIQLTTEDAGVLHQEGSSLYKHDGRAGHAAYDGFTVWPGDDQSTVRTSVNRGGGVDQISVPIRGGPKVE